MALGPLVLGYGCLLIPGSRTAVLSFVMHRMKSYVDAIPPCQRPTTRMQLCHAVVICCIIVSSRQITVICPVYCTNGRRSFTVIFERVDRQLPKHAAEAQPNDAPGAWVGACSCYVYTAVVAPFHNY